MSPGVLASGIIVMLGKPRSVTQGDGRAFNEKV